MLDARVDHIVLGCSHYPYLIPQLEKLIPPHITIIDSGAAVAQQTKILLENHNLLNTHNHVPLLQFFTNSEIDTLRLLLRDYADRIEIEEREF